MMYLHKLNSEDSLKSIQSNCSHMEIKLSIVKKKNCWVLIWIISVPTNNCFFSLSPADSWYRKLLASTVRMFLKMLLTRESSSWFSTLACGFHQHLCKPACTSKPAGQGRQGSYVMYTSGKLSLSPQHGDVPSLFITTFQVCRVHRCWQPFQEGNSYLLCWLHLLSHMAPCVSGWETTDQCLLSFLFNSVFPCSDFYYIRTLPSRRLPGSNGLIINK